MRPNLRSLSSACAAWLAAAVLHPLVCAQEPAPPTPGPEHAALKRLEGEWTAVFKAGDSDSPGTMSYKMECGGLWLSSLFRCEFGGQKFEGRGVESYDPAQKKYVTVWVDSMSTRPLFLSGDMDKEKKTLTMTGEGPGPEGRNVKYKNVTRYTDNDHHTFEMYMVGAGGEETKMLTIEYTRKK